MILCLWSTAATWVEVPQIVANLSEIVVVATCVPSTHAANAKHSLYKDKVLSIISIAGQLSEVVGKVVSADSAVIAPVAHQAFEQTTVEEDVDDHHKGKWMANEAASDHKVLCSTQLGTTERVQWQSERETLTVVKAKGCSRIKSFLHG